MGTAADWLTEIVPAEPERLQRGIPEQDTREKLGIYSKVGLLSAATGGELLKLAGDKAK